MIEPIGTHTVPLKVEEVEHTIECGFRQEWMSDPDHGVLLASGAGFGNRWLTIEIEGRRFRVDMEQFISEFADAMLAERERD